MTNKKGLILNLVLILLIIFIIIFGIYYLYLNIPGNPENLNFSVSNTRVIIKNQTFAEVSQFYPNMKFNHNSISYNIDYGCSNKKRQRMISAFNDLASKINLIRFYEISGNSDIEISCSAEKKESIDKTHFIAGEGGAKEIVQTGRYNIITNGTVLLYKETNTQSCDWANVELHELIHVFGFGHSENSDSLMYPYLENCDQKLDEEIIKELIRLYSEENLPDLYFDNKIAVKKGRYLDFNLTIKNSGSINSEKTNFNVLEDGKLVKSFELDQINYGAGIVIEIKNLKLTSRNPKEIKFIIDEKNLIKEIDEDNNIAIVSLASQIS
jgi:hypothetical protein